jgi:hypothetical protein
MDHKNELLISLNISLHIWTLISTVVTTFTTYSPLKNYILCPQIVVTGFVWILQQRNITVPYSIHWPVLVIETHLLRRELDFVHYLCWLQASKCSNQLTNHHHTNLTVQFPTADLTENAHGYTILKGQVSTCKSEVQVLQESSECESFKVFL